MTIDRVNTKRLVAQISKCLGTTLEEYLGEPNDPLTRSLIASSFDSFLNDIYAQGNLAGYKVVCDLENNPPATIDRNQLVCDVYIQPVCSVDYIVINAIVNSNVLELDSSILTKEDHYEAYERAMAILGKR